MSIASRLGRLARSVAHDVATEGRRRLEQRLRGRSGGAGPAGRGGARRDDDRRAGRGGAGGSGVGSRPGGRDGTGSARAGAGSDGARSAYDAGRAEQRRLDVAVAYDVDRLGLPELAYDPRRDDRADPGEVVWAWVPYDEEDGRGKDRPVLVLARLDGDLLGAQMTSKDRAEGGVHTDRHGRSWIDVGTGAWDGQGRDSEVRLDRLLRLPHDAVRREGAALDRRMYERVTHALESRY
ncbi:type II toxin-antitoxin system PemK/MazF family toxin [Georgenia sp. Z1491]|uniref:type II toxin-antitoxin system PemK/MazF family toxin n=1 Tax=Georgenia sp. Z1491 TaxID=3416707 RepID=UPI003CFB1F4C